MLGADSEASPRLRLQCWQGCVLLAVVKLATSCKRFMHEKHTAQQHSADSMGSQQACCLTAAMLRLKPGLAPLCKLASPQLQAYIRLEQGCSADHAPGQAGFWGPLGQGLAAGGHWGAPQGEPLLGCFCSSYVMYSLWACSVPAALCGYPLHCTLVFIKPATRACAQLLSGWIQCLELRCTDMAYANSGCRTATYSAVFVTVLSREQLAAQFSQLA